MEKHEGGSVWREVGVGVGMGVIDAGVIFGILSNEFD